MTADPSNPVRFDEEVAWVEEPRTEVFDLARSNSLYYQVDQQRRIVGDDVLRQPPLRQEVAELASREAARVEHQLRFFTHRAQIGSAS